MTIDGLIYIVCGQGALIVGEYEGPAALDKSSQKRFDKFHA
jgi:hypothetical protein